MTTNEALLKHNFVTKVPLKSSNGELSKTLKVKIMSMRIELGKIRKEFDSDVKEFSDNIVPQELRDLANKQDRTEEEQKSLDEQTAKINEEYQAYIQERLKNEVELKNPGISEEDYIEIVEIFADEEVDINGQKLSAEDYLEALHEILVIAE